MSLRLFSEGGLTYNVFGLLGFVFIVILVQTGEMMNSSSTSVLSMSIRNEALSLFLSEEKTKEEKLNSQLQQEIVEHKYSQEELQQRNQELEQLNAQLNVTKNNLVSTNKELESALANIRQLSGMLPICSSCKKIRNDSGYWEQIEAYVRDHSEIEFSHSLCPDCSKKLYSDLLPKKENQ
jgi:DNA repair exonuclease SbcCD ATPase subunit